MLDAAKCLADDHPRAVDDAIQQGADPLKQDISHQVAGVVNKGAQQLKREL